MNTIQGELYIPDMGIHPEPSAWTILFNLLSWSVWEIVLGLIFGVILYFIFNKYNKTTKIKFLLFATLMPLINVFLGYIFVYISSFISDLIFSFSNINSGNVKCEIEGLVSFIIICLLIFIETYIFYKFIINKIVSLKMILLVT